MTSEEFKNLREQLGLSQEKMAQLLGVSYATVQSWEVGRRRIHDLTARGIRSAVEEYQRQGKRSAAA